MTRSRVLSVALLACMFTATLLLAGSTTAPTNKLSVGDFAVMVAEKISVEEARGSLTPERAAEILKKAGAKIRTSLSDPLTEGNAADLFQQFGITLQAQHPGNLLDRDRAAALVVTFGSTLASAGTKSESTTLSGKTNTQVSATTTPSIEVSPADCQQLPRPPAPCDGPQSVCNPCMDCCKNQLGLTGKTCGTLCQKKNLTVSTPDPTP